MTDPIADLITRIRNAELARHASVIAPYSKIKDAILKVLKKYRYITDYKVVAIKDKTFKELHIILNTEKTGKTYYKRISRPGQRIYFKAADLKPVKSGLGISIVSTPKGVMSNIEATKENIGGEVICQVW
jgi:small subunit ribosomal protein S8